MKKELTGLAARVEPIISPAVTAAGCTLWDIEYLREGADFVLRITLDSGPRGDIGIDDCERVHRAVDPLLDEADPIESSYCLQVSSPGIERELTLPRHVLACVGKKAEARLFAPLDGSRVRTGNLVGLTEDGGSVLIAVAGVTDPVALPLAAISKLRLVYDFDAD